MSTCLYFSYRHQKSLNPRLAPHGHSEEEALFRAHQRVLIRERYAELARLAKKREHALAAAATARTGFVQAAVLNGSRQLISQVPEPMRAAIDKHYPGIAELIPKNERANSLNWDQLTWTQSSPIDLTPLLHINEVLTEQPMPPALNDPTIAELAASSPVSIDNDELERFRVEWSLREEMPELFTHHWFNYQARIAEKLYQADIARNPHLAWFPLSVS